MQNTGLSNPQTKTTIDKAVSKEARGSHELHSEPLSIQTSTDAVELLQDPFLSPDYLRLKAQRQAAQNESRSEPELSASAAPESVNEQAREKHPWPPIQPHPMSEENKREFLADLEKLDCRDVQTQAQKRIGLLLIGGYTEEEVEALCKPKPIPIDKIREEVMRIQERALKQYERERRAEERNRKLYG